MKNGLVVDKFGRKHWFVNDQLHRTDGPARIWGIGAEEWYENGQLHRTDGPAVIRADDSQEWWSRGQLHRLDGPAWIGSYGSQWYVNGQNITEQVLSWMQQQAVVWPWDDQTQMMFVLTWG